MTNGAMKESLFDLLCGTEKQRKTAEETKRDIFAEFERLGGGTSGS